MSDIHSLFSALSDGMRSARSQYHLTLGGLIKFLESAPSHALVFLDDTNKSPGRLYSYRGYYEDLAFAEVGSAPTAELLLEICKDALGKTFTGYKGGDFVMTEDTPLWVSEYGAVSGIAIVGVDLNEGITLHTKAVD